MSPQPEDKSEQRTGTGWSNVMISTIAAACGIQSKANRHRDFQHGKPSTFIIAGIVFVIVFIFGLYGIVQLVVNLAA